MQNKANLQELFLLRARRDKVPVTVFLMNGFQMRGIITGFDAFVVVLDSDGKQQVIYKHAISTVAPLRRWICRRHKSGGDTAVSAPGREWPGGR